MTATPFMFPGHMLSYVVVDKGGSLQDPPPDQSGTCKVVDPLRHHPNMNTDELPFVTMLKAPTMEAQECTSHPPEPGSVVACYFNMGDPSSRVIAGLPNDIDKSTSTMNGNHPLNSHMQKARKVKTGKRKSKGTKVTNRNGAEVKTANNGDYWENADASFLISSTAYPAIAGTRIKPLKGIDTATQQYTSSFNAMGALGQIAGQFASLSSIFGMMSGSQLDFLQSKMPVDVFGAFQSMSALMTSDTPSGNTLCGARMHPATFLTNTVEMLSQCKTVLDLDSCMHRLQYDESLYGQDQLPPIEGTIDTDFGPIPVTVGSNGSVTDNTPDIIKLAIKVLLSLLGSAASNPGLGNLMPQFGGYGQVMSQLGGRVNPSLGGMLSSVMQNAAGSGSILSSAAAQFAHGGGTPPWFGRGYTTNVPTPGISSMFSQLQSSFLK